MTKSSRAESKHRHFPKRVCQAHQIIPGTDLCPENKVNGLEVCKVHAADIAKRIGWKPKATWTALQNAGIKALNDDLANTHRELVEAQNEILHMGAEIARLKGLTPVERRREQRVTDGMVYALLSGYNVKVGWTGRDLNERLREYPPNSTVLVAFPAPRGEETRIKRKFSHLRTHGNEWFPYAPQVTEWVDQMVNEHGAPDAEWICGPAKATVPRPHADKQAPRARSGVRHIA